jgi:hypothetical protein
MNAVDYKGLRCFAIAALLAIGIGTTIATGGGSSGGGATPTPLPTPPPSEATLGITAANGSDVASAVVIAIGISFDLGDITGENVSAMNGHVQLSAPVSKGSVNFYKSLLPGIQQAPESCANGGTVDVTITQANINTISVGDHIVAVFVDCDDGLDYVIDGTVDMTIAAVQGDILTDVFLLGMDILLTDITVTEAESIVTVDGDFTLTLDSMDFPVLRMNMSSDQLRLGNDGEVVTLTGFDHALQADTGVFPEALVANVLGRLDSLLLGGSVDYDTPVAIEAVGDDDPHVGEILITGSNDSSVRVVIIDSSSIRLDIDENGDGTVDEFIDTTWAELNGRTAEPVTESSINLGTAPNSRYTT